MPGLDAKPLLAELRDRVAEELDYRREAAAQRLSPPSTLGDPDVCVPGVVCVSDHVLVSDWLDGIPLASIIVGGTAAQRDRAGIMMIRFLFSGPARVRRSLTSPVVHDRDGFQPDRRLGDQALGEAHDGRQAAGAKAGAERMGGRKQARDDTQLAWHKEACGGSVEPKVGRAAAGAHDDDG